MKKVIILMIYSLVILGCTRQAIRHQDRPGAENIVINKNEDKEEYELIIIDP